MNWFDTSGLTNLAKTALKEAQKTIDKALDIQDESGGEQDGDSPTSTVSKLSQSGTNTPQDSSDFFASWGLTVSAESVKDEPVKEQMVVTESPSKATGQSVWGSFAGSFFEQPNSGEGDSAIIRPPKAKSMNVIADNSYGSQDDLFSKSQLVMSDGAESIDLTKDKSICKLEENTSDNNKERRSSSRSARLSLVSSRNSSDSVEVLSQSLKTTPDSEAVSVHSMSHSSSVGQKLNSESVEILPDSLLSPSSIECIGFDSISSDKNSSTSSNLTPDGDSSDKKSTPVNEKAGETADSVSLVADDDEDTISYNSISECTAPTVLDIDEKSPSPFQKTRTEVFKKHEKELLQLEQPLPQRMQISENSSNDGSWSDRTLNADNDSIILDSTLEEQKKDAVDSEDNLLEKLSDSSSFYNVNVSSEMLQSESSAFVNVEKQQCNPTDSNESSQKDGSVKERTSPISSDSKSNSDLVKIGSDRTSGHTSGDELETTTSSDIEIIPSPNGDSHSFCRSSPAKYAFKQSKFDGSTSPNLVDLVLGKSLATKIRGHNRELSEASVQSNTSDESQGSENDRLMRRLCEMAEILESRESRLIEVSRSNAELAESNTDLKSQLETLMAKHEGGDINLITEDYTQRMSALEKKFQQAIREKDQLRKQLDSLKTESAQRKNSSELENSLKEKDEMISALQEEGEKLSRQQLQHSNIIKKLRAKEKDNEQVIKGLRGKISELTAELDRAKRAVAAKEELEVTQIEAVYRLTTANKKLETELMETRSALDDAQQRLETSRTSLEATRRELTDLQRSSAELQRRRDALALLERDRDSALSETDRLRAQVQLLRNEMVQEESRWISRTEALRHELEEARGLAASLEANAAASHSATAAALLPQLAALQRSALDRERAHNVATQHQAQLLAEAETSLAKATERERVTREENQALLDALSTVQGRLQDAQGRLQGLADQGRLQQERLAQAEELLSCKSRELESVREAMTSQLAELQRRLADSEARLADERAALDTEKKRNAILQEQLSGRGDISPPHSVMSDSLSASLWANEEGSEHNTSVPGGGGAGAGVCGVEELVSLVQRREGELRALVLSNGRLAAERRALADLLADLQAKLNEYQSVQEQYDALLQMYGEKEEQLSETRLDLHDVTQLYKAQLDELILLKQQAGR